MLLSVLRVDYEMDDLILSSHIVTVLIALLAIISGVLIYIVHGHQIGYYKLTESIDGRGLLFDSLLFGHPPRGDHGGYLETAGFDQARFTRRRRHTGTNSGGVRRVRGISGDKGRIG